MGLQLTSDWYETDHSPKIPWKLSTLWRRLLRFFCRDETATMEHHRWHRFRVETAWHHQKRFSLGSESFQTKAGWWFGTCCIFPYIGHVIIPNDELIFFRGVGQPPTSCGLLLFLEQFQAVVFKSVTAKRRRCFCGMTLC